MSRKIVLFVIFAICLSGCAATPEEILPPDTPTPEPIPTDTPAPEISTHDKIIVVFENLFPEGIEYDEKGDRFLLGSMSEGIIFQVFDDGTIEPFIEDPDLTACLGLEIDQKNRRLLVVNNDEGEGKSYLNSYDLVTGERIFISDISSIKPDLSHTADDVAVDAEGNAYVTDSGSNPDGFLDFDTSVIYKVDMEGNPSLFMEDSLFLFLNGLVYHPNNFLLLGSYPGLMLKIPLDNPELIKVEIPEGYLNFDGTDGMIMHPDGSLIIVTYPDSIIGRLQSDDDWETAQFVGRSSGHSAGYGTTIALRGDDVYIIYSHLDRFDDGLDQRIFEIVRVIFE